jgi:hypothetical protein
VSNLQNLSARHLSLLPREFVQLLHRIEDTSVSQQYLAISHYATLRRGQHICGYSLTETTFLKLFCREGENRKQFSHRLYDDPGHLRIGWDSSVDLKAIKEVPDRSK